MIELIRNRLWPYISPYKSRITGVIVFAFVLAAIGVVLMMKLDSKIVLRV